MNYVLLLKTKIDNNIKHNSIEKIPYKGNFGYGRMHDQCLCGNVLLCYTNEEGDCMPFSESETNGIIKCLKRINEHIKDMIFKVQNPIMTFRTF